MVNQRDLSPEEDGIKKISDERNFFARCEGFCVDQKIHVKKVFGAIFLLFAPIEPSKATQIKVVVKQEMHFHAKIIL